MKEKMKKNLIGFIIGVITAFSISVIAATYFPSNDVTYDNTVSGLQSTNVQGAIDELYGVCFPSAGDQIIEDGELEKDPYECRYFFTGADPNNYVTFNNENAGWRIISVECDGTIKIMRNESIGNQLWDGNGHVNKSNNWAKPATLNTYLNSTYYNELNVTAQSQIVAKDFSIGAVTWGNNDLAGQVNSENSTKWNGKIALPTLSEYFRTNSNKEQCRTFSLFEFYESRCPSTTWMYNSNINYWWTLSPYSESTINLFVIGYEGSITTNTDGLGELSIRPTLYLSSDIKINGGTGTSTDPYILS